MSAREPWPFLAALAAMMAATYLMRAAGYWLMGRVPIRPRLKRMLEALPGAVIAATVVPVVAKGGAAALLAVGAAGLAMVLARNDFVAVLAGMAAAVLVRIWAG